MPKSKSQVPYVEQLCFDLGYNTGAKPYRPSDLTASTREWRDRYVSDDGIPGRDIIDWISDKGNNDILVMSQRFLEEGYGAKHWPPGNGGFEYDRDQKHLLELLHPLLWRQNLAARNNQIVKERRAKRAASGQDESLNGERASDGVINGSRAIPSLRNRPSQQLSDSKDPLGQLGDKAIDADLHLDSEKEVNARESSLKVIKVKFDVNLEQYRAYISAFSNTGLASTANMVHTSAASVPSRTATQAEKSTLGGPRMFTAPQKEAIAIYDSDGEPLQLRSRSRRLTRSRNISGSIGSHGMEDEIGRLSRKNSSRKSVLVRQHGYTDNPILLSSPSPEPQSPNGTAAIASHMPNDLALNESGGEEFGIYARANHNTKGRASTRKRLLSEESIDIPTSKRSFQRAETTQKSNASSIQNMSADPEFDLCNEVSLISSFPSSRTQNTAIDNTYPSPMDTQEELSAQSSSSNRESISVGSHTDDHQRGPALRTRSSCYRCFTKHLKCDNLRPCKCCQTSGNECIYSYVPKADIYQSSTHNYSPLGMDQQNLVHDPPQINISRPSSQAATQSASQGQDTSLTENTVPTLLQRDRNHATSITNHSSPYPGTVATHMGLHPSGYEVPRHMSNLPVSNIPASLRVSPKQTPQAVQPPQPSLSTKTKPVYYYILATDFITSYEEPWSGPPLAEMKVDSLFTQATVHTSGRGILKIRFTLSSSQPGFVRKINDVVKEDAEALEEMQERFQSSIDEAREKEVSKFRILLEPELEAETVTEES